MSAKILIIDDDSINTLLLSSYLKSHYYITRGCLDTAQAMKQIIADKPDLIIVDAIMPNENGFDFARKLKMHPQYWDIPIIMVTSLDGTEYAMHAIICGIDDFIVKPATGQKMLVRVKVLLKQKSYVDIANDIAVLDNNFVSQIAPSLYPSECAGIAVVIDEGKKIDLDTFIKKHRVSFFNDKEKMLNEFATNSEHYDVCLVDFSSKSFDANSLCAEFLASANGRVIPLIAMTDTKNEDEEYKVQEEIMQLGVGDAISIEANSVELELRLSSQIRFRRYLKMLRGRFGETARLARTDTLTGAYNRFYFANAIEKSFKDAQFGRHGMSLVMFDIDYFKKINDRYGHIVGDGILKAFVKKIMEFIRKDDTLCRYGGEEFVLIMPKCPIKKARNLVNIILESFGEQAIECGGHKIVLSFSAGISCFAKSDKSFQQIIQRADDALYKAKRDGRSCVRIKTGDDSDSNIIRFPTKAVS